MMSDRVVFDRVDFLPCAVTVRFVRSKVSVCPCVLDDVIIYELVEGAVIDFIEHEGRKKLIVLGELRQDW